MNAHDASTENVIIRLSDNATATTYDITPRTILDSALGNAVAESSTGVTIAVFDLPDRATLPAAIVLPATVTLTAIRLPADVPLYSGAFASYPQLEILGDETLGNGPTDFWPFVDTGDAEAPPSLRFQGKLNTFPTDQAIGALQFELVYPLTVSNPRAFVLGEAEHAAVSVSPSGLGRLRVVVIHPSPTGFVLPTSFSPTSLGAGPFLDVSFDKTAPFGTSDFTVENLIVNAPDGTVLVDLVGDSTSYFTLHARRNL